jgi:hypothetical protein
MGDTGKRGLEILATGTASLVKANVGDAPRSGNPQPPRGPYVA